MENDAPGAPDGHGRTRLPRTTRDGRGVPNAQTCTDETAPQPVIAIVTITKDDLEGIRKTIRSVEQQDFRSYEHVVVDGGSRPEVIDELMAWRDTDVRRRILVTDPPAGIYPAMNVGITNTSAPIILVLNGGDELLPEALRRVNDSHIERRWRWAYGGIEARDPDGHLVSRYTFSPYSRTRFRSGLEVVPHPSAYVARDVYQQVGLYREDLGSGADQEFFLRACMVAEPGQIPGFLAVFETGGISSREGLLGRELSWHRMRVASRTAFGGGASVDWVVTALLLGHQAGLWAIRKIRGLRLSQDDDAVPTVTP